MGEGGGTESDLQRRDKLLKNMSVGVDASINGIQQQQQTESVPSSTSDAILAVGHFL